MKLQGIRILDKEENIVSAELGDILTEITDGDVFYWSVLYLYSTGSPPSKQSMPAFEETINKAPRGLILSWQDLMELSKNLWDIVDITIVACKKSDLIHRYNTSEEMHRNSDISIEMIDSGYWEIFATDPKLINRLKEKFRKTEFLPINKS